MVSEAADAGMVKQSAHGRMSRIHVLTISALLEGRVPKIPAFPIDQRLTLARRGKKRDRSQLEMLLPIGGSIVTPSRDEFVDPRLLTFESDIAKQTKRVKKAG